MRIPGSDLIHFHYYILIFQFSFLDVSFLQKRATPKRWLEFSVSGIETETEIWNLSFSSSEFQPLFNYFLNIRLPCFMVSNT